MLKRKLMLAHLREYGTNVEMNVAWVRYLQAIIDSGLAEVKIIILDFEGFLKIRESTSELLGSSKDACEVIVGDSSVSVSLLGQ